MNNFTALVLYLFIGGAIVGLSLDEYPEDKEAEAVMVVLMWPAVWAAGITSDWGEGQEVTEEEMPTSADQNLPDVETSKAEPPKWTTREYLIGSI